MERKVSTQGDYGGIKKSALIALVVRITAAGLAYILQVFLAQMLGPHEYGLYAYAWIWLLIGGRSGAIGFRQASIRFIAEYRDTEQYPLAQGFIWASRTIVIIGSVLIAAIALTGLFLFEDIVSKPYVMPLYLTIFCVPLFALQNLLEGQALAWSWTGLALGPSFILRQILIISFVGAAVLFGLPATAVTAMGAVIIAVLVSTLLQYLILQRRTRGRLPSGQKQIRLGYWLKTALPLFLMDSFQMALTFIDVLILGLFVSPAMVAIYFAATRVNTLISLVQLAVLAAVSQRFAGFAASNRRHELENLVYRTVQWTFWPSLLVAVGIIACGWILLRLFGAEFTIAYPLLPILALGMVARASVGPAESLLVMLGRERSAFTAQAISTVCNITLNLALIPSWGIFGAAIATSTSMIIFSTSLELFVRRKIGISSWIVTAKPVVARAENGQQSD